MPTTQAELINRLESLAARLRRNNADAILEARILLAGFVSDGSPAALLEAIAGLLSQIKQEHE